MKAFIFDLNGTMINDMPYHMIEWTRILNDELHAGLNADEVKAQMYGKNSELLIRVFGEGKFTEEEMDYWSMEKERRYQKVYRSEMKLIDGLGEFLKKSFEEHIPMAIGSAAIPFNINFVLDEMNIRNYFKAVVSAEDVIISKPHPETFLKAAGLLNINPADCIVFEDAPKGVEAAKNAGMHCVVLTTMHTQEEFPVTDHVLAFMKDYNDPFILSLL